MEQEHYYAIETKDNELKHYGVKGMHWGIRRYQPYTSNPRKDGKGGKFIGNKPKAKIVKDKKGSIGLTAALGVTAAAVGVTAMKKAAEKRRTKNAAKKRAEQAIMDKQKAKDGVKYMKQKLPENAQKDIANAGKKLRDAEKEMDDLYWTIEDGRATKDTWKKYDEAEKKYEAENDNYRKTLQKWDFDIDGETEYSSDFHEELSKQYSNSKSGLAKDSKGFIGIPAAAAIGAVVGGIKAYNSPAVQQKRIENYIKKANNAKTDEEHDKWNRKAEDLGKKMHDKTLRKNYRVRSK